LTLAFGVHSNLVVAHLGSIETTELFEAIVEGFRSHTALAGTIAAVSVLFVLVYAIVMFLAVTRVSPDYFVSDAPSAVSWRGRHPLVRLFGHVVKNVIGVVLLIVGLAMLVLPGQGMLTIVVALMFLDFPGKRRLTLRILRQRHVRSGIDWIRAKANRPPLILPDADPISRRMPP
jgi:hypothetical protein